MTIPSPAPRSAEKRLGLVGTENTHTEHFIRFLNVEGRHPGFHATALAGGANDRNRDLSSRGGIDTVVDDPSELIGLVDAAIVSTRDGALHAEQAVPLLEAGMPVLVDKPLATGMADARRILDAAERSGAPVISCSALRFVPELRDIDAARRGTGELRVLQIVGPADPDSPYSGLAFYGIHHVEAALQILGAPQEPDAPDIRVERHGDTTIAVWRTADGVRVELVFLTPSAEHRVPFAAHLVGADGVFATELTLGPDYNAPALAHFVAAVGSGLAPFGGTQLLAPVAIMESITAKAAPTCDAVDPEREERR